MADVTPPNASSLPMVINWRVFLTDFPPGTRASVDEAVLVSNRKVPELSLPELRLYCDRDCREAAFCEGKFVADGQIFPAANQSVWWDSIISYLCKKCKKHLKTYALRILGDWDSLKPEIAKLAEWPDFSFQTPSKVNSLIGPDRELFFKGRKAECIGLGVGAFAYYRRIIEDQKNRLLDDIIIVARRSNAPADAIVRLERSRAETQFSTAMHLVKDAVPSSLFINGHNPLTLLHSALSKNLHGASDEACLRDAHDIRVILFGLAERLAAALKDERELNDAVSRLLNPPAGK